VKEGFHIYCEFKCIIFHSFSLQKCASFMNIFGKSEEGFENSVLLSEKSEFIYMLR